MHVRVWLHETSFREWQRAQDTLFFLMLTTTGTAMAIPAVVAPTALPMDLLSPDFYFQHKLLSCLLPLLFFPHPFSPPSFPPPFLLLSFCLTSPFPFLSISPPFSSPCSFSFPLLLLHPLPCYFSRQLTQAGSGGQGSRYHHREVPPRFQHQKQTKQQKYSKTNQGRCHQVVPLSCL